MISKEVKGPLFMLFLLIGFGLLFIFVDITTPVVIGIYLLSKHFVLIPRINKETTRSITKRFIPIYSNIGIMSNSIIKTMYITVNVLMLIMGITALYIGSALMLKFSLVLLAISWVTVSVARYMLFGKVLKYYYEDLQLEGPTGILFILTPLVKLTVFIPILDIVGILKMYKFVVAIDCMEVDRGGF